MKFLKYLAIGLVLTVAVAFAGSFFLDDVAQAEREIVIDRPPSVVYGVLESYRRFNEWSPWADLDPNTKYEFSGPDRGVGAKLAWRSEDPSVGAGSQTIRLVEVNKRIETDLDFGEHGKAVSYAVLTPEGKGTRVVWGFQSDLNGPIERLFGLVLPSMIGADYEKGLMRLKPLVESLPNTDLTDVKVAEVQGAETPAYAIAAEAAVDAESSSAVLTDAYGEIMGFLAANQLEQAGPVYTKILGHADGKWRFEASVPVASNATTPTGRIQATTGHAGKAFQFTHVGSYDDLYKTHEKAHAWLAVHKYIEIGNRFEVYVSDPTNTPVEQLVTEIIVPIE